MEKTVEISADAKELAPFRGMLQGWLEEAGVAATEAGEILVAVQEALTNIIRHAYQEKSGRIQVCFQGYHDRIELKIRDFGKPFDPSKIPAPELPPQKPGGLGLYLIKTLMDKVEYHSDHEGNLLCLLKYRKDTEGKS